MIGMRAAAAVRIAIRQLPRVSVTALAIALCSAIAPPACAQSPTVQAPPVAVSIVQLIAEASQRSGVPASWIAAVIRAESAFDPRATSPEGAMGLMQLMPDTWSGLRARLSLGADPYDPRDNILAGARYLRDLYDQFGAGGFLAAYNGGPGRYLDHLATGRPLPQETRLYVARLTSAIGGGAIVATPVRGPATVEAPPGPTIFVALTGGQQGTAAPIRTPQQTVGAPDGIRASSQPGGLFVGGLGQESR